MLAYNCYSLRKEERIPSIHSEFIKTFIFTFNLSRKEKKIVL